MISNVLTRPGERPYFKTKNIEPETIVLPNPV